MSPLISVIVPSYNSEKYIQETILSVQNQSYQNWECLIIDDGSTDSTKEIVENLLLNDQRIKYYYKDNSGLSDSRNYGVNVATGDFIQFLDSDDILFPKKFELSIESYQSETDDKVILFTDFEFTKEENPYEKENSIPKLSKNYSQLKKINFKQLYNEWDVDFVIPTHAFLFPRFIFNQNAYDITLKSKEDWDFYLSILFNDEDIIFKSIEYVGCGYRIRKNSMSQDLSKMIAYSIIVIHKWRLNKFNYFKKGGFYFFQFNIKKLKGNKGSYKKIIGYLKKDLSNIYVELLFMHILTPLSLMKRVLKR